MKSLTLLMALGAGALLAGCVGMSEDPDRGPPDKTFVRTVVVNLVVDTQAGILRSTNDRNAKCTRFPDNNTYRRGCFVAQYGEILEVKFRLNSPRDWSFTAFEICSGEAKPTAENPCSLDTDQRADFAVLANNEVAWPDANGRVDLAPFSSTLRQFHLRNFNWIPGTYFYRIQACQVGAEEPNCAWMDPGGINNGRGRT